MFQSRGVIRAEVSKGLVCCAPGRCPSGKQRVFFYITSAKALTFETDTKKAMN